jgi:hypothetical protein
MNTLAKSCLSLALGLGLCTSAFAQSGPSPKASMKPEVSKTAPSAPSTGVVTNKVHDAKAPAKKVQSKAVDSAAVKPAEVKKSETGTAHNTVKDLSTAKSVK